jgi:hypothetical protein
MTRPDLANAAPWFRLYWYRQALRLAGSWGQRVAAAIDHHGSMADRAALQKTVLLLESRLGLGDRQCMFRWDLAGPYSAPLAGHLAELRTRRDLQWDYPADDSGEPVPDEIGRAVRWLVTAMDDMGTDGLPESKRVELLACVQWLIDRDSEAAEPDAVTRELQLRQHPFERPSVQKAISILMGESVATT